MAEPTITCPECHAEIKLTKALAAPMISATKKEFEKLMATKEADFADRAETMRREESVLKQWRENLQEQVATQVEESREQIAKAEREKARVEAADLVQEHIKAVEEAQDQLAAKDVKLAEAQKAQADALRERREIDEEKREMDLTVEKRVQEGLDSVRSKAMEEAEGRTALKVREKEETIVGMRRQIEELRQKAEQGSQQMQGEVQELQLEETLRKKFPEDSIDPVPKGISGGDALQSVIVNGHLCGTILWESKRTKTWSNIWLSKLRDDQRVAKADIAIIVSQALPKEMDTLFDVIDKVWVCGPTVAVALGTVLRDGLYRAAAQDAISAGMQTKAEEVYEYFTGSQFKRRVEAIVEAFSTMQEDLAKERRAITKQWTKREAQIERVMKATVGMYGDLEGIAGQSIQGIERLQLSS